MSIAERLAKGYATELVRDDQGTRRDFDKADRVWASARRACVRRMAMDLIHARHAMRPFDEHALARFRRGKERELDIVSMLQDVGRRARPRFEIIEQQTRFQIKHGRRVVISGKKEGAFRYETGATLNFEIKAGDTWRYSNTLAQLDDNPYSAGTADQVLVSAHADNRDHSVLILDRPGIPCFIGLETATFKDRIKSFIREAAQAVRARFGGKLPPHTDDVSLCKACPHLGKNCTPPKLSATGAIGQFITDPELIAAAEMREICKPFADRYKVAHELLKERLRGVELALVGPFELVGRWTSRQDVKLPKSRVKEWQAACAKLDALRKRYAEKNTKAGFRIQLTRAIPRDEPRKEITSATMKIARTAFPRKKRPARRPASSTPGDGV